MGEPILTVSNTGCKPSHPWWEGTSFWSKMRRLDLGVGRKVEIGKSTLRVFTSMGNTDRLFISND